jgi:membrane protein involved in colicin uptake
MAKWLGRNTENTKKQKRQLWEREFDIVKEGLDEKQVISFIDNLIIQYKASQQASAASLRSIIQKAVADAEQIAASIKMKARIEAQDEAVSIVSQAKQEAEEIKRRTEIETQKDSEEILSSSNRKAEITEVEAKQKALLFLLRAKEEIEHELRDEYKNAHSRLSSSLQVILNEGQNIVTELKDKRERLWESKIYELKEHEATSLETSGVAVFPPDMSTLAETEIMSVITDKDKGIEPAEHHEEAQVITDKAKQAREARKQAEKEAKLEVKEVARRKADEAKQAREARKQVEKEAKLEVKEEAKRKADEAKHSREARKQAEKEAKLEVKEEAKRKADEAKQAGKTREQAEKEAKLEVKEEVIGTTYEGKQPDIVQKKMEKGTEPAAPEKDTNVSEPIVAAVEELEGQYPSEESPSRQGKSIKETSRPASIILDSKAIYNGEVELFIPVPVELKMVSKLYNYLQTIPELKVLHTRGSWDKGTAITVVLDKPMPLISILLKIPGVEVTPELLQKDSLMKGRPGFLLRSGIKEIEGIQLIIKKT